MVHLSDSRCSQVSLELLANAVLITYLRIQSSRCMRQMCENMLNVDISDLCTIVGHPMCLQAFMNQRIQWKRHRSMPSNEQNVHEFDSIIYFNPLLMVCKYFVFLIPFSRWLRVTFFFFFFFCSLCVGFGLHLSLLWCVVVEGRIKSMASNLLLVWLRVFLQWVVR